LLAMFFVIITNIMTIHIAKKHHPLSAFSFTSFITSSTIKHYLLQSISITPKLLQCCHHLHHLPGVWVRGAGGSCITPDRLPFQSKGRKRVQEVHHPVLLEPLHHFNLASLQIFNFKIKKLLF
jgi:hypothetical protein